MAIIIHFDIAAAAAVVIAFRFQHFSIVALAAFEIYQQKKLIITSCYFLVFVCELVLNTIVFTSHIWVGSGQFNLPE